MRVLITGGFGFIGGRLGQQLVEDGYDVLLGSRKPQDVPNWLPEAKVVHTNWNDKESLSGICAGADIVVHAAGMNAKTCYSFPDQALAFNGSVTADLVACAVKQNVKKFIYISTAHVYMAPLVGKITESSPTTNTHPYATSHLAGEEAVLKAARNAELDGVVVRLSNAIGAPTHSQVDCWMLIVNDLCRQAVSTGELNLKTSGNQFRDFVTLTDVCRVIEYFIKTDTNRLNSSVLNFGSGESCTVIEMAHLIKDCCREFLNINPNLHRQVPQKKEKNIILDFQMTWLKLSDFILTNNFKLEVLQLLTFCQRYFKK